MSSIISPEDITSLFPFGTTTKPGGNGLISPGENPAVAEYLLSPIQRIGAQMAQER